MVRILTVVIPPRDSEEGIPRLINLIRAPRPRCHRKSGKTRDSLARKRAGNDDVDGFDLGGGCRLFGHLRRPDKGGGAFMRSLRFGCQHYLPAAMSDKKRRILLYGLKVGR